MAVPSPSLSDKDASIIKALLSIGWSQSDIASLFGCNGGRISEINTGKKHVLAPVADLLEPETGAYFALRLADWNLRIVQQVRHLL